MAEANSSSLNNGSSLMIRENNFDSGSAATTESRGTSNEDSNPWTAVATASISRSLSDESPGVGVLTEPKPIK